MAKPGTMEVLLGIAGDRPENGINVCGSEGAQTVSATHSRGATSIKDNFKTKSHLPFFLELSYPIYQAIFLTYL